MASYRALTFSHAGRAGFAALLALLAACSEAGAPDLIVDRVELSSQAVTVGPASTVQLYAVPRTASGQEVPGRTITWTGGSASVATISATGLITAIAFGSTSVSATVDGKTASADVTVVPTQPAHLAASCKIIAVVEIRLDSATKTINSLARYQRAYFFSEYHDGVKMLAYQWGDHGQVNLGTGVPVPVNMFSEYIQNVFTVGTFRPDGKLALSEELWISEPKHATIWSRR
jgi:hypothetical protein